MEHGQATEIARGMIAKMVYPTGRYKEIEIATGLDIKSVANVVRRMRRAGVIQTPRKRGSTKTDIARQMLIDGIGEPIQYDDMARRTGMLVSSLRSLVATMRKKGLLPAYEPESYEYVGTSETLGVVRFRSLSHAHEEGFPSSMVSKAVNGAISGYAKRARRFGIVLRQNKRRVMVAVSNMEGSRGERYEFCGRREVVNAGFNYQTAYAACKGERESAGYLWHFKVEQ